jgi:hypothetical protein
MLSQLTKGATSSKRGEAKSTAWAFLDGLQAAGGLHVVEVKRVPEGTELTADNAMAMLSCDCANAKHMGTCSHKLVVGSHCSLLTAHCSLLTAHCSL